MVTTLLNQVSVMGFEDYNPTYVIRAVNALQPLGKEKALEQIESYLEGCGAKKDYYGLFWVLRVLFEVPGERGFPPVCIGQPDIPPPVEPEKLTIRSNWRLVSTLS